MAATLIVPPLARDCYPFTHPIRVRFAETDAMGVVHHASYLPWLEEARVALIAHGGHDYAEVHSNGLDLAVVEVNVRYRHAIRFGDAVTIHAGVGEISRTLLQIAYLLDVDGQTAATGVTAHACVNGDGRPLRVPEWLLALGEGTTALHR
ncbi:MAG: acyl-CoA thioesterase [Thermoleophilia bacterium]|nr:acyl-CoA thioesterase [Thermoleophilia bacterium]